MKIFQFILCSLILIADVAAQGIDTLAAIPDSILAPIDTAVRPDTLSNKKYDVDTTIFATAEDSIIFLINKKEMQIYGSGQLDYKQTQLKSSNIFVDFETSDVTAVGVSSDTLPGKIIGTPVLSEQGEVYEGKTMKYNFKSGRGIIAAAETETEGAFYTGAKINKVDKDTYFIEDGVFTTCDDSVPHFLFYSPEMKVVHKEQIVAKWIWMYFGGVPFPLPLPFGVFPIESGRRSGILTPAFGQDATYGYYFSRFGYFWAISDYMDWNLTADYYTRGSYNLDTRFRYAQRYNYSGNLEGSYSYRETGESSDPNYSRDIEWRVKLYHNQNIDPTLRFNANLEFLSGNEYLRGNVADISQVLRNNVFSSANMTKTWDESGNSLSLSYSRNQDLGTGNITEILPSAIFSMPQKYPFRTSSSEGTDQKWYDLIGINFNSQLKNNRNKTSGNLQIRGGIQHNLSFNASPKVGYVSITPSFNYQERWYNKKTKLEWGTNPVTNVDTVLAEDVHQINFLRTFSMGAAAQTRFYGIFNPNMLGVGSIRHTVTPSISYNYTPDFSKSFWGYFESYTDSAGNEVRYDPFQKEIFGGTPSYESQAISFSVGNAFEMKTTVDPTDTTSRENKIKLLTLNANMSYDFTAPEFKWSNLNLSYNTNVGELLNLSGGTSFSPYDYDATGKRINQYLINNGKGLLRLTNFNFSISTSLSGERLKSSESTPPEEDEYDEFQLEQRQINRGLYVEQEADFTIPWNLSLNYNFSQSQENPYLKSIFSNISGSLDFNLTPAWKLAFTGSYDIKSREFSAPQVRISRDLHCWIMNFTWNPIGTYRGYRLEIRVKAPQLQDLKITKRDDFYEGK